MNTAQTILAVVLSLVFLPLGLAKIAAVPFMRQAAAHLGMSPNLYRVRSSWLPSRVSASSSRARLLGGTPILRTAERMFGGLEITGVQGIMNGTRQESNRSEAIFLSESIES
ncbi:hypothetical protein [Streptomyces sp. NBC_00078]|uniref:hypothetical protein n=1 Tax=unclassified Streptomyces TaxID=2593676 RepID=UPI00225781EE|nr:hypothetical protein [Streptomyces sp. NBC_00078]MCX5425551.1 hypothetical protein [Streptomyces sp. NBC_00078]